MEQRRKVQFLGSVSEYIGSVPETDQAIIAAYFPSGCAVGMEASFSSEQNIAVLLLEYRGCN